MEDNQFSPAPDNHFVKALLCTLFCCLPLGIVAIVNANKVESLWAQGQKDLARKYASDADKYATWGIFSGLAFSIIYAIICVVIACC